MSNAVERIKSYLTELSTRAGLEQEELHSLRPADEQQEEISLRASDLRAVLSALDAVEKRLLVLDKIQREDNVSKNACAGAVASAIRYSIEEELEA